jgi:multidrug resistance protein MdtO
MASIAQGLPGTKAPAAWFWDFLRGELAPYKGRTALVTRIVMASTLMMVISMTFRLPYGAFGAVYTFTLSRESLEATASAVWNIVVGIALAGAYVILGLMFALAEPVLRFLWITGGFLAGFWALSALRNYSASVRFGFLMAITIGLWDMNASPSFKVESTLWAMGVLVLASLITLTVEVLFGAFGESDDLIDPLSERLQCVEELLMHYLSREPLASHSEETGSPGDDRRLAHAANAAPVRI